MPSLFLGPKDLVSEYLRQPKFIETTTSFLLLFVATYVWPNWLAPEKKRAIDTQVLLTLKGKIRVFNYGDAWCKIKDCSKPKKKKRKKTKGVLLTQLFLYFIFCQMTELLLTSLKGLQTLLKNNLFFMLWTRVHNNFWHSLNSFSFCFLWNFLRIRR